MGLPNANIYVNKYRPIVQNRLSDSAFTGYSEQVLTAVDRSGMRGYSDKAWFLFGAELKPRLVTFLNGQRTPTVESTDASFDTLGILFRGYHDPTSWAMWRTR